MLTDVCKSLSLEEILIATKAPQSWVEKINRRELWEVEEGKGRLCAANGSESAGEEECAGKKITQCREEE